MANAPINLRLRAADGSETPLEFTDGGLDDDGKQRWNVYGVTLTNPRMGVLYDNPEADSYVVLKDT